MRRKSPWNLKENSLKCSRKQKRRAWIPSPPFAFAGFGSSVVAAIVNSRHGLTPSAAPEPAPGRKQERRGFNRAKNNEGKLLKMEFLRNSLFSGKNSPLASAAGVHLLSLLAAATGFVRINYTIITYLYKFRDLCSCLHVISTCSCSSSCHPDTKFHYFSVPVLIMWTNTEILCLWAKL